MENVCHPLQAEGHMAGQVGGKKSPGTDTPLYKTIGCQTSVQLYAPNCLSHNKTFYQ